MRRVDTVADFLREVADLRHRWNGDTIKELWFRGESASHQSTTLRPTLYRSDRPTPDILDLEEYLFGEFKRSGATLSECIRETMGSGISLCITMAAQRGSWIGRTVR